MTNRMRGTIALVLFALGAACEASDPATEADPAPSACTCTAEIERAVASVLDTATIQDQTVKSEVERQLFALRDRVEALERAR